MAHVTGRASDERLLEWLALRRQGVAAREIARRYGVQAGRVINDTNAVRRDDAEQSGEDTRGAYW